MTPPTGPRCERCGNVITPGEPRDRGSFAGQYVHRRPCVVAIQGGKT